MYLTKKLFLYDIWLCPALYFSKQIITLSIEAIWLQIIYMFIDYRNNSILAKTIGLELIM